MTSTGDRDHRIGLLLGAEEDWPTAFEALVRSVGSLTYQGNRHRLQTERVHIHPPGTTTRARGSRGSR